MLVHFLATENSSFFDAPDSFFRVEEHLAACLPFARKKARALGRGDEHLEDDLVQEGLIGLYRGLASYDPGRGDLFAFSRTCVVNAMLSFLRKRFRPIKLEEKIRSLAFPEASLSLEDRLEDREFLRELLEWLSPLETAVFDAIIATGSSRAAAELLDWPVKKIENALHRIRKKGEKVKKELDRETITP